MTYRIHINPPQGGIARAWIDDKEVSDISGNIYHGSLSTLKVKAIPNPGYKVNAISAGTYNTTNDELILHEEQGTSIWISFVMDDNEKEFVKFCEDMDKLDREDKIKMRRKEFADMKAGVLDYRTHWWKEV